MQTVNAEGRAQRRPESGDPTSAVRAAPGTGRRLVLQPRPVRARALEETKLALAARPDLPAAYNLRGLIYAAMGDDRQADESFQRACRSTPRDADTMHNYGWFLCQRNVFDEADRLFGQALAQPQYRDVAAHA